LPESNEQRYVYAAGNRAAQRNLVETRLVAGPRGGGEDIVTKYTYEPLYNRLASIIDPRGNSTAFIPSIGAASAERYTRRFFFDTRKAARPFPKR
jgi:hypothetical protein